MQVGLPEAAKAYVALGGAIATALLGVFAADTVVGQVLTVVAVIATAVATWATPNAAPDKVEGGVMRNENGYTNGPYGAGFWVIVAIAVMAFLILLIVAGVIKM
jgi:hypothetical protein